VSQDGPVLAALCPELVRFARGQLFSRHLDAQLAEDVVSDAIERWLSARIQYRSERQVRAWMRTTTTRLVADQVRKPVRSRDVMDQVGVYSLDAPWSTRGA